jgi:membrane protease YdiL (CAAX protease family)
MTTTRFAVRWRTLALVEVVLAAAVVLADIGVPTLVVLALLALSLLVRRQGPSSLGFVRLDDPWRSAGLILVLVAGWSVFQLAVVMPVLNRVTSSRQDVTVFEDLQGNLPLLAGLLLASWTLAAVGEEAVFRGYLPTRVLEATHPGQAGAVLAVLVPAALFALLHTEQGVVGVVLTFLDALFLTWLRHRFASTWAAVLGHGFNNTLGALTFFVVGPVHGWW